MSRIGKNPVNLPDGVTVEVSGQTVKAKGKLGELSFEVPACVAISQEDGVIAVSPANDTMDAKKLWGTCRSRIQNLVTGVSEGFTRNLEINGVGYRAAVQGNELVLQLGFSHEVRHAVPEGITIKCPDQTHVTIEGADKQLVGQTAAVIRAYRPPEPYKGKGIKYDDEYILRKEGKKK